MRICHIIVGMNIGGAEQFLRRLLQASNAPKEALVISLTTIGPIGLDLKNSGLRVEALEISGVTSLLTAFVRLRRILRDFNPDIVQTWMYHADLMGGLATRSLGMNCVVWGVRNTMVPKGNTRQRLISWLCAWLSRWLPKAIVCAAQASREPYIAAGYDARKMIVIGNGLVFDVYDASLTNQHRMPLNAPPTILCVGRLHADKGQDILLEAAVTVLSTYKDVKFVFAGRGCTMENPDFRVLVERANIAGSVVALGERSDIPDILAGASIFCLPSRTEGFPNALIEAMAMERFCVCTDTGDAADVLGETGIVVPPQRPAQLAEALINALTMPAEERVAAGQRAGQRARSQFSIQTTLMRYLDLYQRIMRGVI